MSEGSFLLDAFAISGSFKKSEELLRALRVAAKGSAKYSLSELLQEAKNALARGRNIDDLIAEAKDMGA